jgi:hypothetical protein
VNPEAFKIIEGKLYLSFDMNAAEKFAAKADEAVAAADENWGKLNN